MAIMFRWLVVLICMLQIMPAVARMYQWNDPATGTTQLSGSPPAWYRSGDDGPRVFVFERGRIVDDTAIEVPEERRIALRHKAFLIGEEDRQVARTRAEQAERTRVLLEQPQVIEHLSRLWQQWEAEPEWRSPEDVGEPDRVQQDRLATPDRVPELTPGQVEELRSLLSAWETERARALRDRLQLSDEEPADPAETEITPVPDQEGL